MEQTLNFSSVESPHLVNSEWVLNKVDQNQIFYAYFGDFIPYKKSYNSVFRKDRSASTGFFFGDSGELAILCSWYRRKFKLFCFCSQKCMG